MKAFFAMEISATWNKWINLELICLLRPVLNPDCSIFEMCIPQGLHWNYFMPRSWFSLGYWPVQHLHHTDAYDSMQGRQRLCPQRDNAISQTAQQLCCTPHLMPGNYKKLKISDVSSAPSDLAALVCLALRCVCLKQHSADRVTESMNQQKVLLTVHPCGRPWRCVSNYPGSCYFSVSNCVQPDSTGFCVGVSPHSL